jgi:hypothetical protein
MFGYASCGVLAARGQSFAIDSAIRSKSTGEIRDDVFARWLQWDPVEMCLGKKTELERLRLRYVDCGRRDEYALDIGARVLVKRMRSLGLEVAPRGVRRRPSQRRLPIRGLVARARGGTRNIDDTR